MVHNALVEVDFLTPDTDLTYAYLAGALVGPVEDETYVGPNAKKFDLLGTLVPYVGCLARQAKRNLVNRVVSLGDLVSDIDLQVLNLLFLFALQEDV